VRAFCPTCEQVPMPLSTRTCLKPPPAATIRMMPATGGRPDSMHLVSSLRVMPAPRPRVNMPTITARSNAISGVPRVSRYLPEPLTLVVDEDVCQRLAEHQHHGQQGR